MTKTKKPCINSYADTLEESNEWGRLPGIRVNEDWFTFPDNASARAEFNRLKDQLLKLRAEHEASLPPCPAVWMERLEAERAAKLAEQAQKVNLQLKNFFRDLEANFQRRRAGRKGGAMAKRTPLRTMLVEALTVQRSGGATLKDGMASLEVSPHKSLRVRASPASDKFWRIEDEDGPTDEFEDLNEEQARSLFKAAGQTKRK